MKRVALGLSGPSNILTSSRGLRPRSRRAELRGKRVALGLSGGVDSAVVAHLLKQQGYEVNCIYLNCFDEDVPGCRTKEDRKDALSVALHLNLPFQVLDFRKEYQASVIDYFRREYEAGRTPNPDVVCNRDIKFGLFYKWAITQQQFDFMVTGHYAKIARGTKHEARGDWNKENFTLHALPRRQAGSRFTLARPRDEHKDQTYFLWQVPRERFSRVLFPLGDYLKSEVREIARKTKLPVAEKKDSTGICFIGEVSVEEFLKSLGVKEKEGEVVIRVAQNPKSETLNPKQIQNSNNSNGRYKKSLKNLDLEHLNLFRNSDLEIRNSDAYRVIGKHCGVWFYTIGQRHGFSTDLWSSKNRDKGQGIRDKGQKNSPFSPQPLALSPGFDRLPLYVIEKDVKHNRLVVGFGAECYRSQFSCRQLNWLARGTWHVARSDGNSYALRATRYEPLFVRIRHGGELIPCRLVARSAKREANFKLPATCNVLLREPQRGLAPGQSAVFYTKEGIVLAGGVIQ